MAKRRNITFSEQAQNWICSSFNRDGWDGATGCRVEFVTFGCDEFTLPLTKFIPGANVARNPMMGRSQSGQSRLF
jgi:hypothetical protein